MDIPVHAKLNALPMISKEKLVQILDKIPGGKDLIIDSRILKPLELIIGVKELKAHGVEQIYKLDQVKVSGSGAHRVFMVPPDLISAKQVCDQINSEIATDSKAGNYHVILLYKKLGSVMRLFEEEGLHGLITVHVFHWELFLLDDKVLSFENQDLFKSLFVEGDQSFLTCVAKSVWTLELLFGRPQVTLCVGNYAKLVGPMVGSYCDELYQPELHHPDIRCFLLFDRNVDYASTLLRGCTYTSFLDDVFGINCRSVPNPSGDKKNYNLDPKEEIYSQIKNMHFSSVFTLLSAKTKEMSSEYQKTRKMQLKEINEYITKELQSVAKQKQALGFHINACEAIINRIGHRFEKLCETEQGLLHGVNRKEVMTLVEDAIAMGWLDKWDVMRLVALASLTLDGLSSSDVQNIKKLFLHQFGYQTLPYFARLEKLNLFNELPTLSMSELRPTNLAKVAQAALPVRRSAFATQAHKFKLLPDSTPDLKNPRDPSYVFSGVYLPLACQLVHSMIRGDVSLKDLAASLPNASLTNDLNTSLPLHTFLVYFIGGVTHAEISAFQLLEQLTGAKIIVAATSIISGKRIMQACS